MPRANGSEETISDFVDQLYLQYKFQVAKIVEGDDLLSKRYVLSLVKLEANLYRFSIQKKMPKEKVISGDVLIDIGPSCWVIFTTESHYFIKRVLESLLSELYPRISRIYLNYSQILDLLRKVKDLYREESFLTYFAIGVERETKKGIRFRRIKLRGDDAESDLLEEANKNRIWIEKLGFKVKNQAGMTLLDALITNRGVSRLIYGNFTNYYQNMIQVIADLSKQWDGKYKKVRRQIVEKDVELHPCVITYSKPFRVEHTKNIASKLSSDYMISVLHGGNPYFVADLLDYYDGSSFGLTVLDNKVTISPMLRTTNSALWKLTGRIQDVLGEGDITVT